MWKEGVRIYGTLGVPNNYSFVYDSPKMKPLSTLNS